MKEIAFITGITGQDGLIIAEQLVQQGVPVHGTTRSLDASAYERLQKLDLDGKITVTQLDTQDKAELENLLNLIQPSLIFNFGSMSSVSESFKNPTKAANSIEKPTMHFLKWLVEAKSQAIFFNPCSSEMFGDIAETADESHSFSPKSPYGLAKLNIYNLATEYRTKYGVNVINGIHFNHESHLRQPNFFSRKVISTACRIYRGERIKLEVGNIAGIRDWGWAFDHVKAALTLTLERKIGDFVVATGIGNSLEFFIASTFSKLGLDWHEHTVLSQKEIRSKDILKSIGDSTKLQSEIGWSPSKNLDELIEELINREISDTYDRK